MYIYIYINTHIYNIYTSHTRMHAQPTQINMHTQKYNNVFVCVCVCVCVCVYVCVCVCV